MIADNKTVSLILGSGGARGLAHIGVIQWLEENAYAIRSISGCSMGA
ncbi:MAG: serine protease, partial [Gammaproteobacteria bacterium]|nr:serine protease [Gammaproteobacteria bacterium]